MKQRIKKRVFFHILIASISIFRSFAVLLHNSFATKTEQPRLIICWLHFYMDPGVHVLLFILTPQLKDKTFCLQWKW